MFLQVAIDTSDCRKALSSIGEAFRHGADVVEIGTPVIANCGLTFVWRVRKLHPSKPIYVDTKTIDFPDMELEVAYSFGASTASAMAFMTNENILKALASAQRHRRNLAVSTMGYPVSLLPERVHELSLLGCDLFIAHGQGITLESAFQDLVNRAAEIYREPGIRMVCAGGICRENIQGLLRFEPFGFIVGRAIARAADPLAEIAALKRLATNVGTC
jgi:3-keto-L-gulonate-6-phosphate decarboxylase